MCGLRCGPSLVMRLVTAAHAFLKKTGLKMIKTYSDDIIRNVGYVGVYCVKLTGASI